MNVPSVVTRLMSNCLPYAAAIGLGAALSSASGPTAIRAFIAVTPVITLAIARKRSGRDVIATVHTLDEWRIDSHSDTTPATGAAAHLQAL